MPASVLKYWKFQTRALLTRLGVWQRFERWRLRWRFRRRLAHEPDFVFFRHFDGANSLFVDVGANLGQSALSFRLANRTCPILSFEPNPDMERSLRAVKRFLGAGFDYRLHGLGARKEMKRLYVPTVRGVPFPQCATFRRECLAENAGVRQFLYEWTRTERFDIVEQLLQVVRFDDLSLHPAFVKLDVEGFESEVLAGMGQTLRRCRPLLMTEGNAAKDLLAPNGYGMYLHQPHGNFLRPARAGEADANFFFVPEDRVSELERMGALRRV
jgi:FkbM family methyltransferase